MECTLASKQGPWVRLFDTNVAAAAAALTTGGLAVRPQRLAGATDPFNRFESTATGGRYFDLRGGEEAPATGGSVPNALRFIVFGTDADGGTATARVWGIGPGEGRVGTTRSPSWIPILLADMACTFGNVQGAANTIIGASDFISDTYAINAGDASRITIVNTTDIRGAHFTVDLLGCDQVFVELAEGTAATVNALMSKLW